MAIHRLDMMPWTQAQRAISGPKTVALLPIGATEAHGPHLPLGTDRFLSDELCERVAREIGGEFEVVILPSIAYSVTRFASGFPGTVSVPADAAAEVIGGVADSLGRHGLATLALINSHLEPEHIGVLERVAAATRERPKVLFVNHCRKPWALELSDEFKSGDCHAGSYETSLLLASRFGDRVAGSYGQLPAARHGLVSKMKSGIQSFEEMGATEAYFGEPARASAEEGERLWAVLVRMWVSTIGGGQT